MTVANGDSPPAKLPVNSELLWPSLQVGALSGKQAALAFCSSVDDSVLNITSSLFNATSLSRSKINFHLLSFTMPFLPNFTLNFFTIGRKHFAKSPAMM